MHSELLHKLYISHLHQNIADKVREFQLQQTMSFNQIEGYSIGHKAFDGSKLLLQFDLKKGQNTCNTVLLYLLDIIFKVNVIYK